MINIHWIRTKRTPDPLNSKEAGKAYRKRVWEVAEILRKEITQKSSLEVKQDSQ